MGKLGIGIVSVAILAVGIAVGIGSLISSNFTLAPPSSNTPSPQLQSLTADTIIAIDQMQYWIFIQQITAPESLTLIPNFTTKQSAAELRKNHQCRYGINGGFYTADYQPLGLFQINEELLMSVNTDSDLIDGFLIQHTDGSLEITTAPPESDVSFALQSGPLLHPGQPATVRGDRSARRMLIGQSEDNMWYILAITQAENVRSGPRLAVIPEIIARLNQNSVSPFDSELQTVLNLDGGSASAFFAENDTSVHELTTIGSLLCGK